MKAVSKAKETACALILAPSSVLLLYKLWDIPKLYKVQFVPTVSKGVLSEMCKVLIRSNILGSYLANDFMHLFIDERELRNTKRIVHHATFSASTILGVHFRSSPFFICWFSLVELSLQSL